MTESPSPKRASAEKLNSEELARINAYWRAANYLSIEQIYLLDNSLLREPWRRSTSNRGCSDTGAANAKRTSRQSGRACLPNMLSGRFFLGCRTPGGATNGSDAD